MGRRLVPKINFCLSPRVAVRFAENLCGVSQACLAHAICSSQGPLPLLTTSALWASVGGRAGGEARSRFSLLGGVSRAGLGLMQQEEGLAPVVCLLSSFLGLHHVIQWGGSDDPKSWTCPEDSWAPRSAQVPDLPGSTVVWMLPVLRPKSVPYRGAFPSLLQSSGANRSLGPEEAERAPGVGVGEGMPRPALSRLWRRVVTEEGVRPAPKEECVSAGGGGRVGPLQGFSGVADGALRRWDLY